MRPQLLIDGATNGNVEEVPPNEAAAADPQVIQAKKIPPKKRTLVKEGLDKNSTAFTLKK